MAFRIVADKSDDLPEGLRAHAKQEGDRWVVSSLPEGWELDNVRNLRSALAAERTTKEDIAHKLKTFEGLEDPAAAREALEMLKAGRLKTSKELDEWKKAAEAKLAADATKLRAQSDGLTKQLRELLVDRAAMQAIVDAGGNPKLLMPIVRSAAKAELAEDGTFSVKLVGEDGTQLLTRQSGQTSPMQFSEFVATLRENPDYKSAFAGSGVGGSGAAHASGGSARVNVPGNMSTRELFTRAANATA